MKEKDLTQEYAQSLYERANEACSFIEKHEEEHPGNFYKSTNREDLGCMYFKDESLVPEHILNWVKRWNKNHLEVKKAYDAMPKRKNPKFAKKD